MTGLMVYMIFWFVVAFAIVLGWALFSHNDFIRMECVEEIIDGTTKLICTGGLK